ncbi:YMGG-like glycine zipper-containing protein [Pontibacter roseus]|uniref:YMGG-like glycine zipper-containing protein n=1 Tax=Pontibacter roseus TaxID=336989 RepID=UPI00037A8211|nr:glycine zipper domain-containing protein [Pontibacter roseus]
MKKVTYMLSLALMVSVVAGGSAEAQEQRKGWSPQAKGAVIGAGTGAAAGAIIHKRNRVVGGVVGGVAGGAVGYGIGKHIDNKNKQREEEARIAAAERAAAERAAANRAAANREAASRATVAKNTPAPAKAKPARQSSLVAATAAEENAANSVAMMYNTTGEPIPHMVSAAYLPNLDYGDRTKPYHTSEYRRKSW